MKLAQKIILAVGLLTLGVLIWKMDAAYVFGLVAMVGWGFILIITQEAGAHLFNALGWRLSMRPEHAASYPLSELFKFRIIGDGVNYLTPSATIAGEFARAAQLNPSQPFPVRLAAVVVGKCAQGMSQFLFVLFGAAWVVRGRIPALRPFEAPLQVAAGLALASLIGFIVWERLRGETKSSAERAAPEKGFRGQFNQLRYFLKDHPGRTSLAILMFMAGYAWNTLEVYLICRFLDIPVTWGMALAIEVVSNMIDGILFMVPAKVGTQEAGKTAIFVLFGMPAQKGFAFGIVRHVRELAWSGLGLYLYSRHVRQDKAASLSGRISERWIGSTGPVLGDGPVSGHDISPAAGESRAA